MIVKHRKLPKVVYQQAEIRFRDELKECQANRDVTGRQLRWLEEEVRQVTTQGRMELATVNAAGRALREITVL